MTREFTEEEWREFSNTTYPELRAENARLTKALDWCGAKRDAHCAEIERLTATINGMMEKGMDDLTMVAAFQVNEEQRAEIEQLLATLREIKDRPQLAWSIAVRALAAKDTKP